MGFEFMTGGSIFALVDLISFLAVLLALVSLARKTFFRKKGEKPTTTVEVVTLIIFGVLGLFFSSSAEPKLKISTPESRELREYLSPKDVEIVTPPPRSETLEGFTPLMKERTDG